MEKNEVIERVTEAAAGSPLHIAQFAQHLRSAGPDTSLGPITLETVLTRRLASLSENSRTTQAYS